MADFFWFSDEQWSRIEPLWLHQLDVENGKLERLLPEIVRDNGTLRDPIGKVRRRQASDETKHAAQPIITRSSSAVHAC